MPGPWTGLHQGLTPPQLLLPPWLDGAQPPTWTLDSIVPRLEVAAEVPTLVMHVPLAIAGHRIAPPLVTRTHSRSTTRSSK
ncbi:hypothetical protein Nepgr_028979 [Nepenthes gracilis]|uniref:Uncharacterized protein n=1 Tax=Nepenthes gracilis TaxID=150966 RepID=A0AAD3Y536_NEPGR|nr:hypothetical protein Nepgr_028979 [Nepenthes gracilis]